MSLKIQMQNEHSKRSRIVAFLAEIFLVSAAFFAALPRFIHPTLHMDESYYINAALSIVSGDILLQKVQFDKPFLTGWLPTPGILLLGENAMGFHLVQFIFYLAIGPMFLRTLKNTFAEENRSLVTEATCFIASLAFILNPSTILFCGGSFSEGAFLFVTLVYLKKLLANSSQTQNLRTSDHIYYLMLLFSIKQTAFLIFSIPLFILTFARIQRSYANESPNSTAIKRVPLNVRFAAWASTLKVGFSSSKRLRIAAYLSSIFTLYCISGPEKFAPIALMLKPKLELHADRAGAFSFLNAWSSLPFTQFSLASCLTLYLGLMLSTFFFTRSEQRFNFKLALALSVLLHLFILSRIPEAPGRYFLFFWCHFIAAIAYLSEGSPWLRQGKLLLIVLFAMLLIDFPANWRQDPHRRGEGLPSAHWAELFEEVKNILPENATLHHDGLLWFLLPYVKENGIKLASADPEFIQEARIARPPGFPQYVIRGKPQDIINDGIPAKVSLERIGVETNTTEKFPVTETFPRLLESHFKGMFRLRSWDTLSYRWHKDQEVPHQAGQSIDSLELVVRKQVSCLLPFAQRVNQRHLCEIVIRLSGTLFLSSGKLASKNVGSDREMLTFHLKRFEIADQRNWFDADQLIMILYKSRYFSLGPAYPRVNKYFTMNVDDLDLSTGKLSFEIEIFSGDD